MLRKSFPKLTLYKMGGTKRLSTTSFLPMTSTDTGNSPKIFLIFSFNPNFRPYLVPVQIIKLKRRALLKKIVFSG